MLTPVNPLNLFIKRYIWLYSSSFTCGLAGALASNPVDVVRTRMMNQRVTSGSPMYKGTLDGVMQTWKNEGFFALYKGFWPNWLRLGPWNIIVSFQLCSHCIKVQVFISGWLTFSNVKFNFYFLYCRVIISYSILELTSNDKIIFIK